MHVLIAQKQRIRAAVTKSRISLKSQHSP